MMAAENGQTNAVGMTYLTSGLKSTARGSNNQRCIEVDLFFLHFDFSLTA